MPATLELSGAPPALGVRASPTAPIIVATDGRPQSDAALIVGRLLADTPDALRLVTVIKPLPTIPQGGLLTVSPDVDAARRAEARRNAVAQRDRLWSDRHDVQLGEGDPATIVARLAHQSGATLIVAGLGRHRVSDRLMGDETALRLMRMSDVPVLAVADGMTSAAKRIVVACDFSETSVRAARMAVDLAAPGAVIYLAHVAPRDGGVPDWRVWDESYREDAGAALRKVAAQLHLADGMTVQRVILQGDPATELLAFAANIDADLIATGSHGYGFIARMLIGSVATRVVRASTCSVLTVPHDAVMTQTRTAVESPQVVVLPRLDWSTLLDEFSRRNEGRRGNLEVDDPEIGAQAQEFDYPFLGATYDPHDERVELMFGDIGLHLRHLTRGIAGITQIDLLRGADGRDTALRIAHGSGQTLLTFAV
jgi:nucleotide-binding universal stress UspA family protein